MAKESVIILNRQESEHERTEITNCRQENRRVVGKNRSMTAVCDRKVSVRGGKISLPSYYAEIMEKIFADWLKRLGSRGSERLPRGPNEHLRQQKKMLSILADKEIIARIGP